MIVEEFLQGCIINLAPFQFYTNYLLQIFNQERTENPYFVYMQSPGLILFALEHDYNHQ